MFTIKYQVTFMGCDDYFIMVVAIEGDFDRVDVYLILDNQKVLWSLVSTVCFDTQKSVVWACHGGRL